MSTECEQAIAIKWQKAMGNKKKNTSCQKKTTVFGRINDFAPVFWPHCRFLMTGTTE